MNSFLYKKFEYNLTHYIKINHESKILLAISGGQDSLCLLKFFADIRPKYHFYLGIINIDHQWRNDSVHNTNHIINILKSFNFPLHIYQIHPVSYSELEARNLRYQILLDIASEYQYSIIATAHTNDDQIETCLYNLTRGSTLDGLNSLIWTRKINKHLTIIRPLLNFQRWEISWMCRHCYLPIWSDISNLDYNKNRNRIRQELIPYMKYYLQKQIENNISKFIFYTSIDSEYIRQNTIKIYQSIRHKSFTAIKYKLLLSQHLSLQKRVLHLFFLHNANISLPDNILENIINTISIDSKVDFVYSTIRIRKNHHWLYFSLINK